MRTPNILAACLLFMCASVMSAQSTTIPVEPGLSTGNNGNGRGHKAPIQTPQVWIEDHTLTFDASCVGCTIELVQDNEVVYTTFIDTNGEIEIPSTLSGTIELRLYYGGRAYVGEFEL